MKEVILYTDGSCINNPGPGGWACILKYKDTIREISGCSHYTANNKMELLAVISGLRMLNQRCNVTVYTDSKYISDCFNKQWIYKWFKNGFKTKQGTPVKNQDLWKELYSLVCKHIVKFIWVKGHSTDEMNNRVDFLARRESQKYMVDIFVDEEENE
mgnify:CR=1 FL=1